MGWQGCQPDDAINLVSIQCHAFASLLVERLEDGLRPIDGIRLSGNGHTVAAADQSRAGSLFQPDEVTVMVPEDFLQAMIVLEAECRRAVSFLTGGKGRWGGAAQMAVLSCS